MLNGTKAWVTNGERAALVALAARTDEGISASSSRRSPAPPSQASRSAGTWGSSATRASRRSRWPTPTTGSRPPTSSATPGWGLAQILGVLEIGRINIARAVGVAWAALDAASPTPSSTTFGKPIGEHQAIQLKLADMATWVEAALLTRNAAERKAAGLRCDVEAGMAKLFASETAPGGGHRGHAHPRRRRHDGPPGRALLPGRPAHGHRRGHQRDPAALIVRGPLARARSG